MNDTLKYKLVLLITQALSIIIDIILLITFAAKGFIFERYVTVVILLSFEIIYFVVSFFTNYRFSYSTKSLILHNVIVITCVIIQFILNKGNITARLMTNYAIFAFIVIHSIALLAVDISAYYASENRLYKVNKFVSLIALGISAFALAFSISYTFSKGFFGQGYGDRVVVYRYNELSDTYTATGIVNGYGNKATIKKTFNNKPVDSIDLSVFCYSSVKYLTIEERPTINFVGFNKNYVVNENMEILASNSFSKMIRKKLVDIAVKQKYPSAIEVVNQIVPNDLKDNEYCVSFKITEKLLDITNGDYIDAITVKENTKLTSDMLPTAAVEFISHNNHLSNEDLFWNYTNNNKKIFNSIKDSNGVDLLGKTINKNYYNVEITFDDIYKIIIRNDNDSKYEPLADEKCITVSGITYNYKLTTYENAENILNNIRRRDGFSLTFLYNGNAFTSLKRVIESQNDNEIYIDPSWAITFPSISSVVCDHEEFTGIYGDDFTIRTDVNGTNRTNYQFNYAYSYNGNVLANSSNQTLSINNIYPTQSGKYYVTVTVSSKTETSLTKTISSSFEIIVNKKTIDLEYLYDDVLVYDGTTKEFNASIKAGSLINGDTLTLADSSIIYKNAGEYTLNPTILSGLYVINSETASKTINVSKRTINAVWGVSTFTYDGSSHIPTYILTNTVSEDNVTANYSGGGQINVGDYKATITIDSLNSSNYVILNPTRNYSINKRDLTITIKDKEKTYDRLFNEFEYEISGLADTDRESQVFSLAYTNGITSKLNAGTYPINATETLLTKGSNYNITIVPGTLTINKKAVTVNWEENVEFVYKGLTQYPLVVSGNGVLAQDQTNFLNEIAYSGLGLNVGNYTVTATLPSDSNYTFSVSQSCNYEIVKAPLTIKFQNISKTYDGLVATNLSVVFDGIKNNQNKNEIISYELVCGALSNKNVGTYPISLSNIQEMLYGANYDITVESGVNYTINKKMVSLVINADEFVYNGNVQYPTVTKVNGIVSGEETAFISSLTATQTSKNCGNYVLSVINNDSNYEINTNTQSFDYTITPKLITVSFDSLDLEYNSHMQVPSYALNGVCTGDSVHVVYEGGGYKNVGSYSIEYDIDDSNYSINTHLVDYSIHAKELTVEVTEDSATYNKTTQRPSINLVGIEEGDTVTPVYNIDSKNAGTYVLSITSSNHNYVFDKNSVVFVINKALAVVTPVNNIKTYNNEIQYPETSITGVYSGDEVTIKYSVKPKDAGSYNLVISSSNPNYSFNIISISFTIVEAELVVSCDQTEFIYDGEEHRPIIMLSGVKAGDTVNVQYTDSPEVSVGEYTLHFTIDNDNYVLNKYTINYKIKEES